MNAIPPFCVVLCTYSVSPVVFPDPSFTPGNLSTVLDSMSYKRWEGFGRCANIPESELNWIRRQHSSEREKKQAVIHSLTSTHPALSWTLVAHALYWTALSQGLDESCLKALDCLQQLFPIGTLYTYTYVLLVYIYMYVTDCITCTVNCIYICRGCDEYVVYEYTGIFCVSVSNAIL